MYAIKDRCSDLYELEKSVDIYADALAVGRYGLIRLTFQSLGAYALTPVLPRLGLSAFTFAQPFLASSLIAFLDENRNLPENDGYGLIGASFLVYTGIAVSPSDEWSSRLIVNASQGLYGMVLLYDQQDDG